MVNDYKSGCEGKRGYKTRAHAEWTRRIMKDTTGETRLSTYFCPFCHMYHVGDAPHKQARLHRRFNLDIGPLA